MRARLRFAAPFALFLAHCGSSDPSTLLPQRDGSPPPATSPSATDGAADGGPGAAATIVADDTSFQFDPVAGGPQSPVQIFHFTNAGGSPSAPLVVDVHGNDFAKFAIASDDCTGQALPPGATCSVGVTLGSTAAGDFEATLRVHAEPGGVARVDLSGIVTDATLAFAKPLVSLGTVTQGTQSVPVPLTLTNTGGSTSGVIGFGALTSGFSVTNDGCSGQTLAAGATCRVYVGVAADPSASGPITSTLVATSAPGGSATAEIDASVETLATIAVGNVTFGSVGYYFGTTPSAQTMWVTNTGQEAGTVENVYPSGATNFFTLDTSGCLGKTLQPGDVCGLVVTPTSARIVGDQTMTLSVSVDTGHQGQGTADVDYALDGAELDVDLTPSMGRLTTSYGDVCTLASCRFLYPSPWQSVTVTAVPNDGYQFSSWSYSIYGASACSGVYAASCVVAFSPNNFVVAALPLFTTK